MTETMIPETIRWRFGRTALLAIVMAALLVSAPPASAAHTAIIAEETTAADWQNATLTNAEVVRSGDAGAASHDTARSSAVARWVMDYGSGSTAYDHVGNHDGTISGATWTSGIRGQALSFDGTDDKVNAGSSTLFDGSSDLTISVWIKTNSSQNGEFVASEDSSTNTGWALGMRSQALQFAADTDGSGSYESDEFAKVTGVVPTDGNWHKVGVTFDDGDVILFVDGDVVGTDTFAETSLPSKSNDPILLGTRPGGAQAFSGSLDEARLYSEPISPGLNTRLVEFPEGKLSPSVAERWAMDAGQGSTAYGDAGADGSVTNATWTTGVAGNALQFDGDGDYVSIPETGTPDLGSGNYSLSVWVNPGVSTNSAVQVFGTYPEDTTTIPFTFIYFDDPNDKVKFQSRDSNGDSAAVSSSIGGGWTHVVGVREGSEFRLYVNGSRVGAVTDSTVGSVTNTHGYTIGAHAGSNYFTGSADDPRVYTQALSQDSIQRLHQHPAAQIPDTSAIVTQTRTVEPESVEVDVEASNVSANITVVGDSGQTLGSTTVTSSGTTTISTSGSTSNAHVKVDVNENHPDSWFRLDRVSYKASTGAPALDNSAASPQGGEKMTQRDVTLSVPLNDTDFATPSGDDVKVDFYVDGSLVDTVSRTSNGTASTTVTISIGGSHTWHAEVADQYGHTTQTDADSGTAGAQPFEFFAPSTLTFRNEQDPDQILTNVQVNVTAYYSGETVRRNTSDGELDLSGFPVDQPIIIRASGENYTTRTAVIESIYQQSNMFLLNDSVATYQVRFDLQDPTGEYPRSDTVLFVERDLTLNNSTKWRTISGDNFGVKGVPVTIEQDERYRLRVRNLETGATATIGAYTAIQSETVTVSPGSAKIDVVSSEKAYGWETNQNETGQYILFEYLDTENETTSIKLTIHERFNKSNVLVDNVTFTDTNDLVYQQPLTNDEVNRTWMAEIYLERGGETIHFREAVTGPTVSIIPINLDETWRSGIGVFVLLITGMMFSELNRGGGAVATSLVGGMLWQTGFLSTVAIGPAVVLAIGVATLYHYRGDGGGV